MPDNVRRANSEDVVGCKLSPQMPQLVAGLLERPRMRGDVRCVDCTRGDAGNDRDLQLRIIACEPLEDSDLVCAARAAARENDCQVGFIGDVRNVQAISSSALPRSSIRSSGCSSPTETRSKLSGARVFGPSTDARCSIKVSGPDRKST